MAVTMVPARQGRGRVQGPSRAVRQDEAMMERVPHGCSTVSLKRGAAALWVTEVPCGA